MGSSEECIRAGKELMQTKEDHGPVALVGFHRELADIFESAPGFNTRIAHFIIIELWQAM